MKRERYMTHFEKESYGVVMATDDAQEMRFRRKPESRVLH
jgi:hypothetical protein